MIQPLVELYGGCVVALKVSASVGQNFWMTRWTVSDTDFVLGYDPETWDRLDVLGPLRILQPNFVQHVTLVLKRGTYL